MTMDDLGPGLEERDPVTLAAERFFGISYLFPYQRLVVANILEAAEAAGFPLAWPDGVDPEQGPPAEALGEPAEEPSREDEPGEEDRGALGRQIVILPTGAGKSLCFQLPALLLSGPTLAIYPLLSLMADQERRLREKGLTPVILRGGQSREEREGIWRRVRSRESRLIIANPEALLSPGVQKKLPTLGIIHVVIDEAHCVGDWGESFRPDYLRIPEILEAAGWPPLVTAFTATAGAAALEKIEGHIFGNRGALRIIGNPDRSNITYAARGCILRDLAVRDLLHKNPRPAIVFCSSRRRTENLARYLRNELEDREIRFYHAGLNQEEKKTLENWFFGNPRGTLVSTCAYGMGVDKPDIRTVIHRDCPPSVEAYLQESGRAGRDGKASRAFLLWGPGDEKALARAKTGVDRRRLAVLLDYGRNARRCRRERLLRLLAYEGEEACPPEGECCDVCSGTAREDLREEPGLLAFFKRHPRSYTLNEAPPILAGIPGFHWSEMEARTALQDLLQRGQLRVSGNLLWKGKLLLGSAHRRGSFPTGAPESPVPAPVFRGGDAPSSILPGQNPSGPRWG